MENLSPEPALAAAASMHPRLHFQFVGKDKRFIGGFWWQKEESPDRDERG
jgi:hypothetical protein